MVRDIRKKLIELARLRTTWAYSNLNEQLMLGLNFDNPNDRVLVGDWLDEISRHEKENDRPYLSALITRKDYKREQGDGFYKMASDYENKTWEALKANKEWENKMIADCFKFWLDKENYRKFKNAF